MKKENRNLLNKEKRKSRIDGRLSILLFVGLFGCFFSKEAYSQWKATTPLMASTTPRITPPPNPTPRPLKLKKSKTRMLPNYYSLGLSNIKVPEKYVRKVVLEFSKEQFSSLLKEDGGTGYLGRIFQVAATQCYEGQFDYGFSFTVDQKGNIYLVFQNSIKVFDSAGNRIGTIKKDSQENKVSVDEDGDVWIYSAGTPGMLVYGPRGNSIVVPKQRITDFKGKLIVNPELKDWFVLEDVKFSHGIIYSGKNGDVYFEIPGANNKNIPSTEIEGKQERRKVKFLSVINGFNYVEDITTDYAGNVYRKYLDTDDSAWPPSEIDHVYKFDPQGQLLAGFDFMPRYINPKTQAIYRWEFDKDYFRIVSWEKVNDP